MPRAPSNIDNAFLRRSRRLSGQQSRNYAEGTPVQYTVICPTGVPDSDNVGTPFLHSTGTPPSLSTDASTTFFASGLTPLTSREARPPRPPNAFILFRSDLWAREKQKEVPIGRSHQDFSRIAGHCWSELDSEEKARYQKLADHKKHLHALQYPGYRYTPITRRRRALKKKVSKGNHEEEERCRKLASLVMEGVSHADMRVAMKGLEKSTTSRSQSTIPNSLTFTPHTSILQGNVKLSEPNSPFPSLLPIWNAPCAETNQELHISTQLDPSAGAKTDNKNLVNFFDVSIRPPGYNPMDYQLGSTHSGSAADWHWSNYNDLATKDIAEFHMPAFREALDSSVDFTDPFVAKVDPPPSVGQQFDVSVAIPGPFLEANILSLGPYDTDFTLDQYFHFN